MHLVGAHDDLHDKLLNDDCKSHECDDEELSDGLVLEYQALAEARAEQECAVQCVECKYKFEHIEGWLNEVDLLVLLKGTVVDEEKLCDCLEYDK